MRNSETKLARQCLSLLSAHSNKINYVLLGKHHMQHVFYSNSPSLNFLSARHADSVKRYSSTLPRALSLLHIANERHQHQHQHGISSLSNPLLCQQSTSPWHKHYRVLQHIPAAAAGFTASTPVASLHDDDGPEGELHAVETAIRANALIFAAKLAVFFVSNSSAMLAEAVHSLVDIANQMLLRVGIMKAQQQPTQMHPYGYARDQFIWPLISAVGIFCCGAGVSFVHGVTGLLETHRELGDLYWNFVVLGVSGVLESHSLSVAVNTLRRRAAQQGMNLLSYIKTGADPAAVAVMMEDGAAVAGLFVAGGCLALCQATGAVYWDAIGSIAVSGLLGVVAVTLIQRNRKWLIGKSMPRAQEELILEHLHNDCVIRSVANVKSEELGVRQYRFQADIAFDGEELARRALDRCGRTRLFKALDAAVRRHDPHALDALLMQFAAVIVSTTGAEVDRLEREIMRLVPGTRWVDLETDRGKPSRLSSTYAAAQAAQASAAATTQQQQPPQQAAEAAAAGVAAAAVASIQQQQMRDIGPLDSISEQDHLADLTEYPLGSLMSFENEENIHENVPEWIRAFAPEYSETAAAVAAAAAEGAVAGAGDSPAAQAAAAAAAGAAAGAIAEALRQHQQQQQQTAAKRPPTGDLGAIESGLYDANAVYKPFCDSMFEQLQPINASSSAGDSSRSSSSNKRWDMQDKAAREAASRLQFADWLAAEALSQEHGSSSSSSTSGSTAAAQQQQQPQGVEQQQQQSQQFISSSSADVRRGWAPGRSGAARVASADAISATAAVDAVDRDVDWGEEEKRRQVQRLHDLEDKIVGPEQDALYKPFCEGMFQALHPDQPKLRRSALQRQQQELKKQQQQQQQQQKQQRKQKDS